MQISFRWKSSSTPVRMIGEDLLRAFYKLLYLRFCVSNDQGTLCSKDFTRNLRDFYMKTIVTIIPTNLVTNSLSFLFCSFVETKNKNHIFSKLVVWLREIFLCFIYSESCSPSKVCRIQ